jgi:hypothetical protein
MANPVATPQWEELKIAAPSLKVEAEIIDVRRPEDIAFRNGSGGPPSRCHCRG